MSASSLVVAVIVAVAVAVACARGGRVVSALRTRHLAATPPRRRSRNTRISLNVTRTSYAVIRFIFSLYDVYVLLYLYSLRFHVAWPRESSHSGRIIVTFVARPHPLLLHCIPVFAERFASHFRRVATLSACASLSLRT